MICFPNAKINLGLHILRKRPDGYHDIASVMMPVDWCDILEIIPNDRQPGNKEICTLLQEGDDRFTAQHSADGTVSLHIGGHPINCPDMEKNLVVKAYRKLQRLFPTLPPVDIYLYKIIPDGAGLGGGSSDAAFTLVTLNSLFRLKLDTPRLASLAAELGADCPFFIANTPMLASGTGTTLTPCSLSLKGYTLLIVKPDEYVSTAEAYSGVTPRDALGIDSSASIDDLLSAATNLPPQQWHQTCIVNDFEPSVFTAHPVIAQVKQQMLDAGAIYAAMSGSGAAVFGIFESDIMAEKAAGQFIDSVHHICHIH